MAELPKNEPSKIAFLCGKIYYIFAWQQIFHDKVLPVGKTFFSIEEAGHIRQASVIDDLLLRFQRRSLCGQQEQQLRHQARAEEIHRTISSPNSVKTVTIFGGAHPLSAPG